MDKKEKLTENVKVRVSSNEKIYIEDAARSEGISMSDLIRNAILDKKTTSSYAIKIQQNRIKHEMRNKIISMRMSKDTKNKLLKELAEID